MKNYAQFFDLFDKWSILIMTYKVINSIEIKFYVGFQWKNACLFKPYVENFDRKNTQNYFNLIFNEV